MSDLLRKAVDNSIWTGIGSIGTVILAFFFAGVTIRWLGQAEAGFAIAVGTIVEINNTFSGLGLGTAATRQISKLHNEKDFESIQQIAGVCMSASLGFGLLGFGFFSLGSSLLIEWTKYEGNTYAGKWYCFLSGLIFLLSQILVAFNTLLISLQRFDLQTKLNLAFGICKGICGITLLKIFPNLITVGVVSALLSAVNVMVTGLTVRKVFRFMPIPLWNLKTFLELWNFGKWIYLTQITGSLLDGLDKIILVSFFGSAHLPLYTFAQKIYKLVHQTLVNQAIYLFPMLSAQQELDAVAERTQERLRWFIGLVSSLIFSATIIGGKALLAIVVNYDFADKASFQLFVFSWVGYIHAQAIVPFFFGMSKGDAKGNWIFHLISGFGMVSCLMLFSISLGFRYAVLGNLAVLIGVLFLGWRYNKMKPAFFISWFFNPLHLSILLMCLASITYFVQSYLNASITVHLVTVVIFYFLSGIFLARIERMYLGGAERIETFGRAAALVFGKIGVAGTLFFQFTGIPYKQNQKM